MTSSSFTFRDVAILWRSGDCHASSGVVKYQNSVVLESKNCADWTLTDCTVYSVSCKTKCEGKGVGNTMTQRGGSKGGGERGSLHT